MATYQILPQEPMCCAGDLPLNWKRFLKLFEDYAIATELTKKSLAIHVATPKRVMGKESKQILERLQLLEDELEDTTTVPDRLEADLVPARNGLYEKTATKRDDWSIRDSTGTLGRSLQLNTARESWQIDIGIYV